MLIETPQQVEEAWSRLPSMIVADVEADGKNWWRNEFCSLQVAPLYSGDGYFFPFRHKSGQNLPENLIRLCMRELEKRTVVGHNWGGFDRKMLIKEGFTPRWGDFHCTMLDAHILDENEESYKLEELCDKYLPGTNYGAAEARLEELVRTRFGVEGKGWKAQIHRLPAKDVYEYGMADIYSCRELYHWQRQQLESWGLEQVSEGGRDYQHAVVLISVRGMRVDRKEMERFDDMVEPKVAELRPQIEKMMLEAKPVVQQTLFDLPGEANPRSHIQVHEWLADILPTKWDRDSQSYKIDASSGTLNRLSDDPRCALLAEFRKWDKLKSGFSGAYDEHLDGDIIHPELFITTPERRGSSDFHGTSSSRLSAAKPNLQQVPLIARGMFLPPDEGDDMAEEDYSQAEIRWAGHEYATRYGDLWLGQTILDGVDIHQATADAVNLIRKKAKNARFALQFGAGVAKIAEMANLTLEEAEQFMRGINAVCPSEKRLRRDMEKEALANGYIRLWTGRVLRFPDRKKSAYKAQSRLIQGSIAEVQRVATVQVSKRVPEFRMCQTIHDALMGGTVPKHTLDILHEVRRVMQSACPECSLPLVTDAEFGPNWRDLKKIGRHTVGVPDHIPCGPWALL